LSGECVFEKCPRGHDGSKTTGKETAATIEFVDKSLKAMTMNHKQAPQGRKRGAAW
jgi:hypothetical protein